MEVGKRIRRGGSLGVGLGPLGQMHGWRVKVAGCQGERREPDPFACR